jgi:hypothetical protein
VKATDIPSDAPIHLRTNSLNYVMPGIAGKYGYDHDVNAIFTLKGARNYRSWHDNQDIYARTDANIVFNVTLPDGTYDPGLSIDLLGMDTYFSTSVTGNNITMIVNKLVVREIKVIHCAWGEINTNFLVEALNVIFLPEQEILPMMNQILTTVPLQIAEEVGNIFSFDDLKVTNMNDYIMIGASPKWKPHHVKPRPGPRTPDHSQMHLHRENPDGSRTHLATHTNHHPFDFYIPTE